VNLLLQHWVILLEHDNLIALQHHHQGVWQVRHAKKALGWLLLLAACLLTLPMLLQILCLEVLVQAVLCHERQGITSHAWPPSGPDEYNDDCALKALLLLHTNSW